MEEQLEQFQQDQLEKYLNETCTRDVSADDLLNWFQNPQSNSSNHFNNTSRMNYSNQDQGHKNFHPYESPSSTTNSMEQRFEHDTLNTQHFRLNTTGQFQTMNSNQEFNNQMNQTLTIPTSTQNFVQTVPVPGQRFVQGLFHIKNWEKIELPGHVAPNLVKTNNQIIPTKINNQVKLIAPAKSGEQTQWQEEDSLEQLNTVKDQGHPPVPIIINNQHPFKIDEGIISQIQNQATKQSGIKQLIKIRNPDPLSTIEPPTTISPILPKSSPIILKTDHKPELITHVKNPSKGTKSRPSRSTTIEKPTTIFSPHKRTTRNIITSKYAKLRSILEKLEDQEYSPNSPTTKSRRDNRTLHDFQVEVVAIMKNDMSSIITRHAISKKASTKTK